MGVGIQGLLAVAAPSDYNAGLPISLLKVNMANTAGARKAARQSEARRHHNASLRSTLRTAIKSVRTAIQAGDKAKAQAIYRESVGVLDRISYKKIIHKNKASRHKSRLSAQIKALA